MKAAIRSFRDVMSGPHAIKPVITFLLGILLSGSGLIGWRVYQAEQPSFRITRHPAEVALVTSGTNMDVVVDSDREREVCAFATGKRFAAHYAPGVDPNSGSWDDFVWVLETGLTPSSIGPHHFMMRLTLSRSLPVHDTGQWVYKLAVYSGCSLFERIFGVEAPLRIPAVPIHVL